MRFAFLLLFLIFVLDGHLVFARDIIADRDEIIVLFPSDLKNEACSSYLDDVLEKHSSPHNFNHSDVKWLRSLCYKKPSKLYKIAFVHKMLSPDPDLSKTFLFIIQHLSKAHDDNRFLYFNASHLPSLPDSDVINYNLKSEECEHAYETIYRVDPTARLIAPLLYYCFDAEFVLDYDYLKLWVFYNLFGMHPNLQTYFLDQMRNNDVRLSGFRAILEEAIADYSTLDKKSVETIYKLASEPSDIVERYNFQKLHKSRYLSLAAEKGHEKARQDFNTIFQSSPDSQD